MRRALPSCFTHGSGVGMKYLGWAVASTLAGIMLGMYAGMVVEQEWARTMRER